MILLNSCVQVVRADSTVSRNQQEDKDSRPVCCMRTVAAKRSVEQDEDDSRALFRNNISVCQLRSRIEEVQACATGEIVLSRSSP